jgi:hypothetical protein
VIAFLLISTVLLWILIKSKAPIIVKFLLVFAVLWYGVVLLNIPSNFMGWPKSMIKADYKRQYIKDYFILEPTKERRGAIYLWLINRVEIETSQIRLSDKIKLTVLFSIKWVGVPRAYSLKYSRDLHKRILEVSRKVKNIPGGLIRIKKENKKGNKEGHETGIKFEVINPRSFFTKEE